MDLYKISKLLNELTVSKFATKKWSELNEVNDLSSGQYYVNKNIKFRTPKSVSNLCDYSDAYLVVKRTKSVTGTNNDKRRSKKLTFKNNAWFRLCISKIQKVFTLLEIPMYNLLEYSQICSFTSGSLWNYYRDEVNDDAHENNDDDDQRTNNIETIKSKSFEHNTKIESNNTSRLDGEAVIPLKYLGNFWRTLDLLLINYKIELDLSWSRNCMISEISRTPEEDADPDASNYKQIHISNN